MRKSLSFFVLVLAVPLNLSAQLSLPHGGSGGSHAAALGRDFWFPIITNHAWNNPGTLLVLYVTAPDTADVSVQLTGKAVKAVHVSAGKSSMLSIPLTWMMQSSGNVSNFGVHVWSDNAGIVCYFMSEATASSDGMYLIPSDDWGTEYVIAGYTASVEGWGGIYFYDEPSEFAIVADRDGTKVNITPSADLRIESSDGGCCSCLLTPKGQTFQVSLDRGQSIQFKSTCAQDCDNYDLTGTVITSNYPVGVVGGSEGANIPCDFGYTRHVFEMLPPVNSWGRTYYTAPFFQKPGNQPSHNASTFLVIATKPGQIIYRYDNDIQQEQTYYLSSKVYDSYWRNDIDQPSRWTSIAPFLLVQYINSPSYPDNFVGSGFPAEVIINPIEHFSSDVLFQTADSSGTQQAYTNYVNVITNKKASFVTIDGQDIRTGQALYVDGIYSVYRFKGVSPGAHEILSDKGVGVYVYGYRDSDAYAWTGSYGKDSLSRLAVPAATEVQMSLRLSDDGHSIRVVLPTDYVGTFRFEIENVLGERVLSATALSTSDYIDANALTSGVYFYRMEAGGEVASGKIVIAR